MSGTYASAVYPVPNRFVDLGKEAHPGSVAAATYTFPTTTFKPVDKVTFLEDNAWRNAMAQLYNVIEGVQIADMSIGGPLFADGMGYPLAQIMGDYSQGIAGGTVSASTSLSAAAAVGAGTIVVASATSLAAGDVISIGGTSTTACEVRKITSVSGGTLVLSSALYQAHGTGTTAGTVISWSAYQGILHTFYLLNNGLGAGGWTASQPPTYTYYDYSGVPATTGARQYAYSVFSEVTISSDATKLVEWDGKFMAVASEIASATPTVAISSVIPQAAWLSTVSLNGSGTYNTAEWKLTLQRKTSPKYTNMGQQDPFALPLGYFTAEIAWTFDPASDEAEYLYMRNNTQPAVELVAANGLSGTAYAALTVNAAQAAMVTSELNDGKDVFGFDNQAKLVANTTNIGPSGGYSPLSITLQNQVISY